MKKIITLFFVLQIAINYILGQDSCKIEKYKFEPYDFVIGNKVTFQAYHIVNGNDTIYRLDNLHYSINIEGVNITNPQIVGNNKGVVVRFIVPDSNILIGKKYLYFVYNDGINGDNVVGAASINIKGKIPCDFIPDVGVILYKGDEYQTIEIQGRNLTSITGVSAPDNDILFKSNENYKIIDNKRLEINVKAEPGSTNKGSIILKFSYTSPIDNITKGDVPQRFIIGISDKGYKDIRISESVYLLQDFQKNNKLEFTAFLDNYFNPNHEYEFKPFDLPYVENTIRLNRSPDTKSYKISLFIDNGKLAPGRKQFQLLDKSSNEIYCGYITVLQDPIIKSVSDYSRNRLIYTPYEVATIVVEGVNVGLTNFEIIGNQDSSITISKKILNANQIQVTLDFDENKTKITSYKFRLSREKIINEKSDVFYTDIWPEEIIVTEPREIANLDDMIEFEIDGGKIDNIQNPMPVKNRQNVNILITGNNVADSKGPQAINIVATLFSEDGEIVESKNYDYTKTDESKYLLINTKTKHYNRTVPNVRWNEINKAFGSTNIRPWSKLKIEVSHDYNYYKSINENPQKQSQEFILKGNFWDYFNSTITVPPTLIVWGQKKVDEKYQWKAQVLPLNIGYGIQYQFRDKNNNYEKIPFSLGAYLIGLNYLQIEDEDTTIKVSTEISDSTIVTKTTVINNNLIEKGAVCFVLLAEGYMFNKEAKVQLPFQLGMGWTIPLNGKKSQWFGVIGFGISYKF